MFFLQFFAPVYRSKRGIFSLISVWRVKLINLFIACKHVHRLLREQNLAFVFSPPNNIIPEEQGERGGWNEYITRFCPADHREKQTGWYFIFPAARLNMEREKWKQIFFSLPASTTTRRGFAGKCWQRHRTRLVHSNDQRQGKEQANHNNAALRPPNVRIISSSESNPVRLWCVIIVCEFFQTA